MKGYLLFGFFFALASSQYTPDWDSLDKRPLPSWFDQSKFGIFIHWGVFSVPSYGCNNGGASGEWYWWNLRGAKEPCLVEWHKKTYGENFLYEDFAPLFQTQLFNPDAWADIFRRSGAKYVVLTSKHHDGFCNWPSPQSWNWNSMDVGPHQDNIGLISQAVRKAGLRMGLYHSLFEWFNPLYLADKANQGKTTVYVNTTLQPMLRDIVNSYKPDVIWADGDWEMYDTYWGSKEFLAWLYNESPVKDSVVVNDRWGIGDNCKHGGYWSCDDRYNPGKLQTHKWENALTIDTGSWGYRRNMNMSNIMTINQLIHQLASTVSCGGNMLLNVGPTKDGILVPIFEERLLQIGDWLNINGESIYGTKPWRAQNDTAAGDIWYTCNTNYVYAIFENWPMNNRLILQQPKVQSGATFELLGVGSINAVSTSPLTLTLPPYSPALPSSVAWVVKMKAVY